LKAEREIVHNVELNSQKKNLIKFTWTLMLMMNMILQCP